MKDFFLNFTKIVERNPKIYWSIIFGIAACLMLFVAEIVHIQNIINALDTKDQQILREAIQPVSAQYKWARVFAIVAAVAWSVWEYSKTKNILGLGR